MSAFTKFYQGYLNSEVDNISQVAVLSDSTSYPLEGKYFTFPAIDKTGNIYQIAPWFKVGDSAPNPINGTAAQDALTFFGDSGADSYTDKYMFIYDGLSSNFKNYYFWFNKGDSTDPGKGVKDVSWVKFTGDSNGKLSGKFITVNTPTIKSYVWFYVDGSPFSNTDPGLPNYGGIQARVWINADTTHLKTAVKNGLNLAYPGAFTFSDSGPVLFITNNAYGAITADSVGLTWTKGHPTSGTDPTITGYTSLFPVGIQMVPNGDSAIGIAVRVTNAFNGLKTGWIASRSANTVTITHPSVGNPPPAVNGNIPISPTISATAGTELFLGKPSRAGDSFTMPGDSAGGRLENKYWTIFDGTSKNYSSYYAYYTKGATTNYDPKLGVKEVQTISCLGDSGATSLNQTYFLLDGPSTGDSHYVYLSYADTKFSDSISKFITGAQAIIPPGDSAIDVAHQVIMAIRGISAGAYALSRVANKITLTSEVAGVMAAAVDGYRPTGFTFAVSTTGVAPIAALSGYTSLISGGILLTNGDTKNIVGAKTVAAVNAHAPGWQSTRGTGPVVKITHKTPGNAPLSTVGNLTGMSVPLIHSTAGSDATVTVPIGLRVDLTAGDTAKTVAYKLLGALRSGNQAYSTGSLASPNYKFSLPYLFSDSQANNKVSIISRWPWAANNPNIADGTSPRNTGFSFTTAKFGDSALTYNMIQNKTTNVYLFRPDGDKIFYLRKVIFAMTGDSTIVKKALGFGSDSVPLTNGIQLKVMQGDSGQVLVNLTPAMKANYDLVSLGTPVISIGNNFTSSSTMVVHYDIPSSFGSSFKYEIPVDGNQNQSLQIAVTDNLALGPKAKSLVCHIFGHYQQAGDVIDAFGNPMQL
ncbi:MAG TPA: hypothetical protein VMD05_08010 [Candidatus Nanoarchaeia archaeon]|nr:hypothetical protein [Candidatus Nanoarchaeia archaeon]